MALMGLVPVVPLSTLEEQRKANLTASQNQPVIQNLAAHVRKRWEAAKDAKIEIEQRMLRNVRQRRGEYEPQKLAAIKAMGGSEIFMPITSVKCAGAVSWLRDTLGGNGTDKPWTITNTPVPELPPAVIERVRMALMQEMLAFQQANGMPPDPSIVMERALEMKEIEDRRQHDEAKDRVARMELKMEDQLLEGGFPEAFAQFMDDLTVFPTAFMKGPVIRKRKVLKWNQAGGLTPTDVTKEEWERVDPFMLYPSKFAHTIEDGPLIERHSLSQFDLEALIGVEGYNEDAIRQVLLEWEGGGLREWLWVDSARAAAEGRLQTSESNMDTVDALQLWDTVSGKLLIEWGMTEKEIPDPAKSYDCEVWLVGSTVIRAALNYDPLGRRPYYAASYEVVPGSIWGNSVADLVSAPQEMCNAAARAISNNMGLASGPQVGVNISRLPPGEPVTGLSPWRVWQFRTSEFNDGSKPIEFFQPDSHAEELMRVFTHFSQLADEYSRLPRYMMGEHSPGVGRTSSGLSMLINNAGKGIKYVIANIDLHVLTPLLERLYQHNLRYAQDPDLIGDVTIVARGALSLVAKEAAAVRRNEFLQLALQSPVAQQIMGLPGVAELLRENAKLLDINVDKVVPDPQELAVAIAQQQAAAVQNAQAAAEEEVSFQRDADGAITGFSRSKKPQAVLPDGTPAGGRDSNTMSNRS